ncbi:Os11g0220500 [Oryza sativa Japonica Group]|uniref:Os11g0220500 protein n=1 Tax=Oryza sativa subsp. japonica TaxID=39947 RepID=A0A0P0Y0S8_ORYSJ|nr:Os11g0220500 [Oryza sativa Japonica Group]
MASGGGGDGEGKPPAKEESTEYRLRKYLLLLATLVATVTYAAGLNLPGGSWEEDAPAPAGLRVVAGDPILRETRYTRYVVFYACNAVAFAASLVVSLIVLVLPKEGGGRLLGAMRAVMVVDLLGLMGAYAAGSSRDGFTTAAASALLLLVFAYVAGAFLASLNLITVRWQLPRPRSGSNQGDEVGARDPAAAGHLRGDDRVRGGDEPAGGILAGRRRGRGARRRRPGAAGAGAPEPVQGVLRLQHRRLRGVAARRDVHRRRGQEAPPLEEGGAVRARRGGAAGARRRVRRRELPGREAHGVRGVPGCPGRCLHCHPLYSLSQPQPIVDVEIAIEYKYYNHNHQHQVYYIISWKLIYPHSLHCHGMQKYDSKQDKEVDKICEYIQLLATLAATIAYQAGIDPPGGVWGESGKGHRVGDPILLTTHPRRFKVFFYFNSAAFVASLVIMALSQNKRLVRRYHAVLEATMILDLFGLIGAYAVGCCRDTSTSIYIIAMAGAVLVYVVIHIVFFTLETKNGGDDQLEEHREVLLLLTVLAATLTYQAGLTPPGGFWENDEKFGYHAGFPVLLNKDPCRYKAFFYCNAASFMASVALIVLLMNKNLYRPGIRSYALIICMVAGMFGVLGAYAAGSSIYLRTFIIVLVLVLVVFVGVICLAINHFRELKKNTQQQQQQQPPPPPTGTNGFSSPKLSMQEEDVIKYLMLVGILAASITYLTGLKPPGGLWRDEGDGHSAGNPVLYDINMRRYNTFFYSNSTSFMASITVIVLLLQRMLSPKTGGEKVFWPMHTVIVLDMLALLVAYAAGSVRDWETSKNVFLLLIPIQLFVGGLFFICKKKQTSPQDDGSAAGTNM